MICFYRNLLPLSVRNWGLGEWGGFHSNARKHSGLQRPWSQTSQRHPPPTHTFRLPPEMPQLPTVLQPLKTGPRRVRVGLQGTFHIQIGTLLTICLLNSANLTIYCLFKVLPISANAHQINECNFQRVKKYIIQTEMIWIIDTF